MLYVLVPAYNESENLPSLLRSVAERFQSEASEYLLVVVDDGSQDTTYETATSMQLQLPLEVVRHPRNFGPGRAFDTGFRWILARAGNDDLIVTLEADNTSDPAILREMLRQASHREADVVLASCYAPGGGVEGTTPLRLLLSGVANLLLRVAFPLGIHTYSSFYRVYRAEVLREAYRRYDDTLITEPGFVCMVEVLVKLGRLGVRLREVPMTLRCQMRRGDSKMKVVRTILAYLRLIARYRLLGKLPQPGPAELPAAPPEQS